MPARAVTHRREARSAPAVYSAQCTIQNTLPRVTGVFSDRLLVVDMQSGFAAFRVRFKAMREWVWGAIVSLVVFLFFHDPDAASRNRLYAIARRNKYEVKRFVKFAIVGISGLVVDYAMLNILVYGFGVQSAIAIAVAFVLAATNNFVWNILWVYPESRASFWRHFPTFLTVNAVGLGINELILFLFEQPIEALFSNHVIGLNLTKAIAAIVVMMWNFFVNRFVTFRHVKWSPGASAASPKETENQVESAL